MIGDVQFGIPLHNVVPSLSEGQLISLLESFVVRHLAVWASKPLRIPQVAIKVHDTAFALGMAAAFPYEFCSADMEYPRGKKTLLQYPGPVEQRPGFDDLG